MTRPLRPLAGDPEGRAATHGSEDPKGGIPRGLAKHNSLLTRVQELTTLALTAADNNMAPQPPPQPIRHRAPVTTSP
ncbi:hypothetical protein Taro_005826 [Colocasia esculenta]|uniref:Uncharacterized protein n=1 Tax=Colocasia esculenta TaxID=4460 RepID=A0A843TVN5_COLES|nr:hypothetical protein [Colocasia esculenta]